MGSIPWKANIFDDNIFPFLLFCDNNMASCGPDDLKNYDADAEYGSMGKSLQENEWQKVKRRKRKRFNTGTVDLFHFQSLSGDDKLAILFGKLIDIEEKMPSFRELQSTVEPVREKISWAENSIKSHEQHIKTVNYKSVDLEARSRRKNLIFRSLYEGY